MHTALIQQAISNPETLGENERSALEEVVATYPWFAVGQVLLAKTYHNTGSLKYDDQLHLAAVHAGSRSVIYDLIVSHEVSPQTPEAGTEPVEEVKEIAAAAADEVIQEESLQEEVPHDSLEEPDAVAEASDPVTDQEVAAQDITPAATVEDSPEPEVEETPEEDRAEELKELDRTILTGAVSRVIEQEVAEEVGNDEEMLGEQPEPAEEPSLSGFAAWVLKRSRETGYIAPGSPEPGTPLQPETHDTITEEGQPERKHQESLIDAFIASDPKITPGKASEYNTEDMARESLREDDSFVTETMAKVYARQGKLSKARKAYELLALKYPEKSVYFANQLKKLEKKK